MIPTSGPTRALKYLEHTKRYYEFLLLSEIDRLHGVRLPLESGELGLTSLMQKVTIHELVEKGYARLLDDESQSKLILTEHGGLALKKHFVDYQLELIALQKNSEAFFRQIAEKIKDLGCRKIALYGASDTTSSLLKYLGERGVEVTCIIDDDKTKQGTKLSDFEVKDPSEVLGSPLDAIVVSTIEYEEEVFEKASRMFAGKYDVYKLFS